MSHSLTAVVGLGVVLGTGALVQPETVQSDELAQTEIAPGTSIPPLQTPNSRVPSFVLMAPGGPPSVAEADVTAPLTIGSSGLFVFGPEGVRLPAYEPPDIATGSVKRIPRR